MQRCTRPRSTGTDATRDRSDLDEDVFATALRVHYDIDAVSLAFVSGGEDAFAWVYRVDTRYLVKVREAHGSRDVAAAVSRYLVDSGVPHVVAPIPSTAGLLTVEDGGFSYTVYPFLDGRTGVDAGLTEQHWLELGRLAQRLHATVLPADLARQVATETYRPAEIDSIAQVDRAVSEGHFAGAVAEETAAFWAANRAEILALAARTAELGPLVEQLSLPLVLCHADLHTWNVMIDSEGELWLIDWDEVIYAPKERDLMFVVDGIGAGLVAPHETARFFAGYEETTVDPLALSYYRHAWAVQDIGGYGERIFCAPSLGEEARANAARILRSLFAPGEIVDLARG